MKGWNLIYAGALMLLGSLPLSAAGLAGKPVSLKTTDGWTLSALYQPAQEDKKTVVLVHDLGKDKTAFTKFAATLEDAGYGYIVFDLRGHGESIEQGEYKKFAREGLDNEFNKMPRDVEAALSYVKEQGVSAENIVLIGCGLGANVAAKSVSVTPEVPSLALISPAANIRDVLTIPSIRLYKGNVLIAAGADDKKNFLEASVIRNVAFVTAQDAGLEGTVTFLTAYDLLSHEMLDKYLIPSLLQWLSMPARPQILPDPEPEIKPELLPNVLLVDPSSTEEALVPSVLG